MRDIGFHKETVTGRHLSPFDGFEPKDMTIEERYDETTGVASRILPYRVRPAQKPDTAVYLEKSPESICPFCPALFDKITPRFTPDIIEGGKFTRGSAFLFPNAFPYDATNTVAIFSHRHFVGLDSLTPDAMRDGFAVCRDYFYRMAELQKGFRYGSINWNYMPTCRRSRAKSRPVSCGDCWPARRITKLPPAAIFGKTCWIVSRTQASASSRPPVWCHGLPLSRPRAWPGKWIFISGRKPRFLI